MKRLIALIFLLFASIALWAQADSLRLVHVVRGVVTDVSTGERLESVHVSVPGRHFATVTNADGEFILKSDTVISEVEFSFLGYKKMRVPARDYIKLGMKRENLSLAEASIITGDPAAIVSAALKRLRDNYCQEPELLKCFYRETVQKRNRYTYVAEAVANLYKDWNSGRVYSDAAALEKSRLLVSQRKADTLSVKTQGGPNMAIVCDPLKNSELLFHEDDMPRYQFTMEMPAYIGDRLQFVIRLTPVVPADYALYHCLLYIDREWLSFTRIEATLDMSDQVKAIKAILVSKPMSLRFFPKEASLVLNYRPLGEGKMRLEYFRSTIRFDCDWRKRLFRTHYTAINELVVTDVYPKAVPIPRKERFRQSDYLNDRALEFLDPDFWADYNIIEPSESLEHAIGRLKK